MEKKKKKSKKELTVNVEKQEVMDFELPSFELPDLSNIDIDLNKAEWPVFFEVSSIKEGVSSSRFWILIFSVFLWKIRKKNKDILNFLSHYIVS